MRKKISMAPSARWSDMHNRKFSRIAKVPLLLFPLQRFPGYFRQSRRWCDEFKIGHDLDQRRSFRGQRLLESRQELVIAANFEAQCAVRRAKPREVGICQSRPVLSSGI